MPTTRDALDPTRGGDTPTAPPGFEDSETPRYLGRAVVALASDPDVMRWTRHSVSAAQLSAEYGFTDVDGRQPNAWKSLD